MIFFYVLLQFSRKFASVNQKGVLSVLMDHFSSTIMQTEPKARSFAREFLSHDSAGCAPSSNKVHYFTLHIHLVNTIRYSTCVKVILRNI